MRIETLAEAIELLERVKIDKSQKLSGSVDIESTAQVNVFVKIGLPEMRVLLSRQPLEIDVPDSNREGHTIAVTLLYVGKVDG